MVTRSGGRPLDVLESICHVQTRPAPVMPNRRLLTSLGLILAVFVASLLPALATLNASLIEYLGIVWWAVLLRLLPGGIVD